VVIEKAVCCKLRFFGFIFVIIVPGFIHVSIMYYCSQIKEGI
jgi:hypothetical protein